MIGNDEHFSQHQGNRQWYFNTKMTKKSIFQRNFFFNAFFVFFFASLFKSNDNKQKKVDNNIYKVSFNVELVLK